MVRYHKENNHKTSNFPVITNAEYFIYLFSMYVPAGTAKTTKHVQALMNLGKIFLIQIKKE